ncbi:hypothetical protein HZ994_15635 [Akkermansiaceae bacterium]|nr:hypothetical protein HZ994_15635 [Akkermansiaceae bacterium]
MKSLFLLPFAITTLSATPENPLIPSTWFQEITATDGSTQQCVIFTTVPGVEYTFYHSDALETWTEIGKTYGLGHEFAAAMRETAPAPPPPDPENPPPMPPVPNSASIAIQASSGASGGTVVSWPSHDHGNAIQYLIAGNIASDWDTVPIFAASHGTHQFFITRPAGATTPPVHNPFLETKDAAMIADLEAGFADFNTAVAAAATTARNTPPPPPPAPGAMGYWRIKADWSLDSDGDGSPDHLEFALAAAQAAAGDGLVADPFNADTNKDGIPDGQQLDSDVDGIPDALDIAADDGLVAYEIVALPRYAMFVFPAATTPPIAINDRGTVLFPNKIWKGGVFQNLINDQGQIPGHQQPEHGDHGIYARAINERDQIIGSGNYFMVGDGTVPDPWFFDALFQWPSPEAIPAMVSLGANGVTTYAELTDSRYALHLDNDGNFFSHAFIWDGALAGGGPPGEDAGWKKWTLPAGGNPLASAPAAEFTKGTGPGGIVWGSEYDILGAWSESNITSPFNVDIPVRDPVNILDNGNGNPVATSASPFEQAQVFKDNKWQVSQLLADTLDIADNGTAIRKHFPEGELPPAILLNGKWTSIARAAPGIPERWKTSPVAQLSDTSPGGWILAHDRPADTNPPDNVSAALLPIRIKGRSTNSANVIVEKAVGVDAFSIGSSDPATSDDNIDHVQDRIWIMAPRGSYSKEIVIDAPIHETAPLTLSAEGITFGGQPEGTVTAPGQSLMIRAAPLTDTGSEILLDLKMGDNTSVSKPVGFKVMKYRKLKVTLWLITSDQNPPNTSPNDPNYKPLRAPDFQPTKELLDNYLNDLFTPQLNVEFDCKIEENTVRFDTATGAAYGAPPNALNAPTATNGHLDTQADLSIEFDSIRAAGHDDDASINLYVVGGATYLFMRGWFPDKNQFYFNFADGLSNIPTRTCVIANGLRNTDADFLDTIGHEIGHILVGEGHPDLGDNLSPLPGTNHGERLMRSGTKKKTGNSLGLLVKREWDDAEKWLTAEEARLNNPNQ